MLNKINILKLIGIGSLCLFLLGCSEERFLMQENASNVILEEDSEVFLEKEAVPLQNKNVELNHAEEQKTAVETQNMKEEDIEIAVHICGAVNQPGVYYLKENQRLYEAISKAGGFREDADEDYLNQALILEDGMKIVVPTKEETAEKADSEGAVAEEESADSTESILNSKDTEKAALEKGYLQKKEGTKEASEQGQKVDLNTADEKQLCTLPGIGESRAKSIIAYRQEHGHFQKTEDIMKISGIKEAAYDKIKEYIVVSD